MIRLRLTDKDGVRIQALLRATKLEADRVLLEEIGDQIERQARNARAEDDADDDDDEEEAEYCECGRAWDACSARDGGADAEHRDRGNA